MGSLHTDFYPVRLEQLGDIESKTVLKKLASAANMPNQEILISTLSLQEAKDSSAIENIITTHDDLYQSDALQQQYRSTAAKEVHSYARALRLGYERVLETGLLTIRDILEVQATIEENDAGFRKLPGTELKNRQTGQTVYTPPQHPDDIQTLMSNLEQFMNRKELTDWDPLTKMSLIHHQFESIHPFYDSNGRTGRVLNILYLVKEKLLGSPVLYLSRYINNNKAEYYAGLQDARNMRNWEPWLLYMITGIEQTARQTSWLVNGIKNLMQICKERMKRDCPRIYSHDLLNNLFRHPYTKIDFVVRDLKVTRKTAAKYLEELVAIGLLSKRKIGKENFYRNDTLYRHLQEQTVIDR